MKKKLKQLAQQKQRGPIFQQRNRLKKENSFFPMLQFKTKLKFIINITTTKKKTNQMESLKNKWTKIADEKLIEIFKVKKGRWSEIAAQLNQMLKGFMANGKQCRDRYINYLKFDGSGPQNEEWRRNEWKVFNQKFMELGPKWTEIAKFLPGNSENKIKNKFYGLARRITRVLNKRVKQSRDRDVKPLKYESIVRILKFESNQFMKEPYIFKECKQIKETLMIFGLEEEEVIENIVKISLVKRIHAFNLEIRSLIMKNSKKTNQKKRQTNKEAAKSQNLETKEDESFNFSDNISGRSMKKFSHERELDEGPLDLSEKINSIINEELDLVQSRKQSDRKPPSNLQEEMCEILNQEYVPEFSYFFY